MAESGGGRSTVMRARKTLEATGFITRRPQFHDSGAQQSTRYYLNHPQAPHLASRPDLGPSRAQTGRRGFPKATPQGGQIGTPEPPYEPSTEPRGGGHAHAQCSARSLADRAARCRKLIPAIESALAFG